MRSHSVRTFRLNVLTNSSHDWNNFQHFVGLRASGLLFGPTLEGLRGSYGGN